MSDWFERQDPNRAPIEGKSLALETDPQMFLAAGVERSDLLTSRSVAEPRFDPFLDRVRRGDPAAIAQAYGQHHTTVRAFALRLLGDRAAAEDLVHDVFVALPRAARSFEERCSFKTFLLSIAVNHARRHVRTARRRRAAFEHLSLEPAHAQTTDPERDAERGELAAALARALDELPLDQRVAFILCEVEERSSCEAGAIAGAVEATMRTRLFHAKRKLRALLEERGIR
jgi:RNA polymerase sigma-70 factor (ECF subfamily)